MLRRVCLNVIGKEQSISMVSLQKRKSKVSVTSYIVLILCVILIKTIFEGDLCINKIIILKRTLKEHRNLYERSKSGT